ncbi:UNVERIFIED_CONTAM: hypothetical protein GTU68_022856 [Idotea baltica]|nr:hypothetical protein [Idotea baltica]
MHNEWVYNAVRTIESEACRSADTHLLKLQVPGFDNVDLYFKDESSLPTGSLKHRLARSLFLYSLCNGWVVEGTPIIEASSGSTAISEAYFARLLGLPFCAVVPRHTTQSKLDTIERLGGRYHLCDGCNIYEEAERLAKEMNGHYIDQGDRSLKYETSSRIEGIGRPQVEPSFIRNVIDRMIQVPDEVSLATIRFLSGILNRKVGGSTGTNLWAALQLMMEMREAGQSGSVVTLICDSGDRYLDTYYNDGWIAKNGFDLQPTLVQLKEIWPDSDSPDCRL